MPTSENLTPHPSKRKRTLVTLLIGGMLTFSAVASSSEPPDTIVTAAAVSEPVIFQQEDAKLFPTTTAPPTTTTTTVPPTTTTTHAHAPVPKPAPAPAPEVSSATTGSCGGWEGLIAAHFPGEVPKACSVMMCESKGSPTAENSSSSASGLWQFLSSTWESITGTPAPASQYSAETQTAAAAKLRNSSGWGQWSCS